MKGKGKRGVGSDGLVNGTGSGSECMNGKEENRRKGNTLPLLTSSKYDT